MRQSPGFSAVEVLAVLALFGLMMGMAVSNLSVIGNPVHGGANQVMGFLKQARAKAMSTASSYTVFPVSKNQLAVKAAPNCASKSTTPDAKLSLSMIPGAELVDTGWSVCFAARGLPTDNVEVFVRDANNPSLVLAVQVNLGGAVRIR